MDLCFKSPALPVGATVKRATLVNIEKKRKFTFIVQLCIMLPNRLLLAMQSLISVMFMTRVLIFIFNSDMPGSHLDVLLSPLNWLPFLSWEWPVIRC